MSEKDATVTVEFPLDKIHEPMVEELDETDVDVRVVIQRAALREAEKAIYQTYQSVKYANLDARQP